MLDRTAFLPVSREDMLARDWYYYDFLMVTGDAYVDHPSFGAAVIARTLEAQGFRVAVLAQPDYRTARDFLAMGAPRFGVLINAGNVDSMVAHYSVAKRRRAKDAYTPGGVAGKRPDRAAIVYCNRAREAFPGLPIIVGSIEASLRRFAHYDYWDDAVRRPMLADCGADILIYGMGELPITEIARRLKKGEKATEITDVRGTCVLVSDPAVCRYESLTLPSYAAVRDDKKNYTKAAYTEQNEQDFVRGRALIQECDGRYLIQNPPVVPPEGRALDAIFELPYARTYHPDYEALGGVPAIEEVQFSIIHNRGCFGSCNFCALSLHQGRYVTARSHESVLREAKQIVASPGFKGYIHDVGGPTADFRGPACKKQKTAGTCPDRQCLFPTPCPAVDFDHSDYMSLLQKLRALDGVKKVFVRSGIRYDYMIRDKKSGFFGDLVCHHVSGQLKVAPEHISKNVLHYMGKPYADVFQRFSDEFYRLCEVHGKEQYLVPYLMSSHPGSTLEDAVTLAEYLHRNKMTPEQVQDFYPTPGTLSTAMYYTGLDPRDLSPVYVARTPEEKAMQRALLQYKNPKNRQLVIAALCKAGRTDLIGGAKHCLVRGTVPQEQKAAPEQAAKKKVRRSGHPPKKDEQGALKKAPRRGGKAARHGGKKK